MKKNSCVRPGRDGIREKLRSFLAINLGLALMIIGVYFFKIPNGFATGGVSGLAPVVSALFPRVTPALFIMCVNVLLLVLGVVLLGKSMGAKTVYGTAVFSLGMSALERWLPYGGGAVFAAGGTLTDQPMLELVFAILLSSIGSAILFREGASSGGTDIIALILWKYGGVSVGRALLISDCAVVLSAFWVFGIKTGLYSAAGLFATTFLIDSVIENINLCKMFIVITEKPDEVGGYMLDFLHRGVTRCEAEGAFTHRKKTLLLTVCSRRESVRFKARVKKTDPDAFVIVTDTSEILGLGFRSM